MHALSRQAVVKPPPGPAKTPRPSSKRGAQGRTASFGVRFDRKRGDFDAGGLWAKLALGTRGSGAEREANRVADPLLGVPGPRPAAADGAQCPGLDEVPPVVHRVLQSPGRPLDAGARADMEPRFGVDFGAVRVHTGPLAAQAAEAVGARAFALGNRLVFGAGEYRPGSFEGRSLLAHELAHVARQAPGAPVLRRFADCRRLLSANESGPRLPEASVQAFLADELEDQGDVQREFPVPGGSAAPWRTEGSGRDDSFIDPQLLHEWITGRVDIAQDAGDLMLDFLEIKRASWYGAQFAEQQVVNYVDKAMASIAEVQRSWRRRTGNRGAIITSAREMPMSRYTPPQEPVEIDGQQVLLSWCRSGVMVFKALDVDNRELLYCGVSDQGRTDAFIERLLGAAEEIVAQALRRRLRELFPGDSVNIRPLLARIRERLRDSIRWMLSEAISAACALAVEVTTAAVLDRLRRFLRNQDLVDGLLVKLTPRGEGVDLHLGEAAAKAATAITVGTILWELLSLAPAFI